MTMSPGHDHLGLNVIAVLQIRIEVRPLRRRQALRSQISQIVVYRPPHDTKQETFWGLPRHDRVFANSKRARCYFETGWMYFQLYQEIDKSSAP